MHKILKSLLVTGFITWLVATAACQRKNDERIYPRVEPPSSVLSYVFKKGTEGYNCYRIPALIKTKSGTILAFAEGRKNNCADEGDIDLVVKRSTDGGKTWSPLSVIWSDGVNTRRVFVTSSSDDGKTWETPKEITTNVKQPNWGWYATGPCHGIQITQGPHKDRMVIPCDYIEVGPGRRGNSHVIYSDDAGATWTLGGIVPVDPALNPNESTVTELSDGRLMLNMRVGSNNNQRIYSISSDGGTTWSPLVQAPELIDPVCQGSLTSGATDNGFAVFFSNAASTQRRNMTVKMSTDDGINWTKQKLIFGGPSGYSDLLMLDNNTLALLFEAGVGAYTDGIAFKVIPVNDLK
jgi:sialidase-1